MKSVEYYSKLGKKLCEFVQDQAPKISEQLGMTIDCCDLCPFFSLCHIGHNGAVVWLKENDIKEGDTKNGTD